MKAMTRRRQSECASGSFNVCPRSIHCTYSLRSLRLDLFAGLTVAAVAVPQAMAYASIPLGPDQVHYGLYTAIVMTAIGGRL